MLYFLGFTAAWPLLIVGVSCIALVSIVTIYMFIKYVEFQKSYNGNLYLCIII